MKKIIAIIAALAIAFMMLGTPAYATGDGDKVGVCHRTGSETNPYVYIEVPADEANGHITGDDKQHNHKVVWKSDGSWNGVTHGAGDEKLDYLASEQDVADKNCPNRTPVPEEPGNCTDACKMPVVETNAPDVTKCRGIIKHKVLNNVVAVKGKNCVLIDVYVNGSVVANGAKNVSLRGTAVRKNVVSDNTQNNFYFGPRGDGCRYDPMIGGDLRVTDSHNVLVCYATVCDKVKVNNNDGRITVRRTVADRLVLRGNDTFRDTVTDGHNHPEWIRLLKDDFNSKVIRGNAPRKVFTR